MAYPNFDGLTSTVSSCDSTGCIFPRMYVFLFLGVKRIATDSASSVVRVPLSGESAAVLLIIVPILRCIKTNPPGRISRGWIKKHAMSTDKGSKAYSQQSSENFAMSHVLIYSRSTEKRVSSSTRKLLYKP